MNADRFKYNNKRKNISDDQRRSVAEQLQKFQFNRDADLRPK
jgi:hypothetical protein